MTIQILNIFNMRNAFFTIFMLINCIVSSVDLFAQELRGGEIWFDRIGSEEYDIFYNLYLYSEEEINQPYILVDYSVGKDTAFLTDQIELSNNISLLTFMSHKIFPSAIQSYLTYIDSSFTLPSLKNYNSSLDTFFVKTELYVPSPASSGINSSPRFVVYQTDYNFDQNGKWTHQAIAVDPEGDDLTYELLDYTWLNNPNHIINYELPEASQLFEIDALTGTITWDKPIESGFYMIGVKVIERLKNASLFLSETQRMIIIEIKEEDLITKTIQPSFISNTKVFPNPINDILNIQIENEMRNDNITFTISNFFGKIIYKEQMFSANKKIEKQIEVSDFSNGTYFLTIQNGIKIVTKKFIISR